jgi:hypothetical protein
MQFYGIPFMHPYKQFGRWQDVLAHVLAHPAIGQTASLGYIFSAGRSDTRRIYGLLVTLDRNHARFEALIKVIMKIMRNTPSRKLFSDTFLQQITKTKTCHILYLNFPYMAYSYFPKLKPRKKDVFSILTWSKIFFVIKHILFLYTSFYPYLLNTFKLRVFLTC